jgi:hypothetical protein
MEHTLDILTQLSKLGVDVPSNVILTILNKKQQNLKKRKNTTATATATEGESESEEYEEGTDEESKEPAKKKHNPAAAAAAAAKTALIVTPINRSPRSNSFLDYREQLERDGANEQVMWDDTKHNHAKPEDVFAFVRNGKDVTFRKIISVHSNQERLATWSKNVGQGSRQVLFLGPEMATWSWDVWIERGGAKRIQGTTHIRTNVDQILCFL